ncbi:hypothetical protein AVO45_09120 [Ruegeria marisrubri]|uniref:Uncharacterized protein n=2 Tax=Ruegeria marisrubri TaxID=1685379 RepID=A0A0X3TQY6_9RHOB|nr:hypothetical protein AVO45_09120 [Ruegeria marisrubri]
MPTTTNSYVTGYGNTATVSSTTYGGGVGSYSCFYTLYAQPNKQGSYTVVGFEKPKIDCE